MLYQTESPDKSDACPSFTVTVCVCPIALSTADSQDHMLLGSSISMWLVLNSVVRYVFVSGGHLKVIS